MNNNEQNPVPEIQDLGHTSFGYPQSPYGAIQDSEGTLSEDQSVSNSELDQHDDELSSEQAEACSENDDLFQDCDSRPINAAEAEDDNPYDTETGVSNCSYDGYAYGKEGNHHNIDLGKRGEDAAAAFLQRKGFEILARNYTCPAGEADIVAEYWDGDCRELHFVEVKTRTSTFNGFPEEAVDAKKRDRYERISEIYLSNFGRGEARVTFDIISILVTGEHSAYLRMHCNVLASDCGTK